MFEVALPILDERRANADLLDQLRHHFPRWGKMVDQPLVARNLEYVRPDQVLEDGDEVAFFPPVSGG